MIDLCTEYGSLRIQGIAGTEGRLVITMSDPFPGGDGAIQDTHLNTSVRADTGGLRVAMWQQTQGMTTFRSMMQKGARPAAVNVVLELPRTGVYRLNLVANHQRVTVQNVDVHGLMEGYLSPGANVDVGLGGPLTLRLNNETLKADWRRDAGVDFQGGTTATFRPLTSASVESILTKGDVALTFVGSDVGLDVIANHRRSSSPRTPRAARRRPQSTRGGCPRPPRSSPPRRTAGASARSHHRPWSSRTHAARALQTSRGNSRSLIAVRSNPASSSETRV